MTFDKVLNALKEGKGIYRISWLELGMENPGDFYWMLKDKLLKSYGYEDAIHPIRDIHVMSILADDWEVCE